MIKMEKIKIRKIKGPEFVKFFVPIIEVLKELDGSGNSTEVQDIIIEKYDIGENVTFQGDFAIHQKKHFQGLIDNLPVLSKSNNFELYFEEDNLEETMKVLKDNNFEFVHGIREQPWKQQVFRFYDYDQNLIEIGERLEHVAYRLSKDGLTNGEISRITYLPEEIVGKAIDEYSSAE
jgi:catechol 2,3-dioxygenase-like lactoylglutathione lyase family enzyme